MTKIEFIKMLIENHSLVLTGIITDGARTFGWWIIGGLVSLVDSLEKTATKIYSFNDFFNSKGVNDLINAYKPLIYGIFVIALLFLGYSIMLGKKKDRSEIPTNILISAMVIIALPLFMTKLGEVTNLFVSYNISDQQSTAKEIVKDNVSDLYYLDRSNFNMNGKKNDIALNDITNIDINEVLDSSKIEDSMGKDILKQKLVRNEKGEEKLIDLNKGFFGLFDEGYYRYNANFLIIIFSLAITGITLLCISLKVAGIIFELGFKKVFATILAMGDISDGRKLKTVVSDIASSFAILMVTSVVLKMYVIFAGFLGNKLGNDTIINLVVLAGVSWRVIDAPDIVERILGIDAGVKSNWGMVLAGYEGIKSAGRAISSTGRLAKKGFNIGKSGVSKIKDGLGSKDNSSSKGNEGIYGKDKNDNTNKNSNTNTSRNNNTSQNNETTSSANKTSDNSMSSNKENIKDNSKNDKFSRNSGIYNNTGTNINNNKNTNNNKIETKNEGNKANSKINTDKGSPMYDRKNNLDKNVNNGNNNLNKNKSNGEKINTDSGKPIYDNKNNSTNLNTNKGKSINDKNNQSNKSNNISGRVENRDLKSNNSNSNFNIKFDNKTDFNNMNNKNYNIGNQNKWNIKGKGNKK